MIALARASPAAYWDARGLAERVWAEYQAALRRGDVPGLRERFFLLAGYHARTLAVLRYALAARREPLARAALRNLVILHDTLHRMHQTDPDAVPEALTVNREFRLRLFEDMIVSVLEAAPGPLDVGAVTRRVNDLDVLADASEAAIGRHLANLVASGHVRRAERGFARTPRPYVGINLDEAELASLVDLSIAPGFEHDGFRGLSDLLARKERLHALVVEALHVSDDTAALFEAAAETLSESAVEPEFGQWRHADLLASPYPRPYQYEAYAVFRGYGYQGQLVEAPAGSGKTLVGMLCIQNWLRGLSHGETVLVLVPTVNYQQQWVRELCRKPSGLRLPPHLVFAGTPAGLEAARRHAGVEPAVLVLTYAALAQLGSGVGKGGFDVDAIERFLQGNDVQYVLLDEVHKVVERPRSVSTSVTRALVEWLRDGSLRGLIGFSGTAAAYRSRFVQLGLQLVHVVPAGELIATGFVAPFAEIGIPFAFSDREQRVRDLVAAYRALLLSYAELLGSNTLRRLFAELPLAERVALGRDLLAMYAGRADQAEALARRFTVWESGGALTAAELPLIAMVQLARGWSDQELARAAAPDREAEFAELHRRLDGIRAELRSLVYLSDTRRRLSVEGFGTRLDAEAARARPTAPLSAAARQRFARDLLASTFVGLLGGLSEWYARVGEGRVSAVKAILAAERALRPVESAIVFDGGRRIHWQDGLAAPGYGGVGGLFAELLGDGRFTPLAVLSSELYLPHDEADPLPRRIAGFVRRRIMRGELANELFELATAGASLSPASLGELRATFDAALADYVEALPALRARRRELSRRVLSPLRRAVRRGRLGGEAMDRILGHLSLRQHHLRAWLDAFLDYAAIADRFDRARIARLEQASGACRAFAVVRMAEGDRKQLMYDLAARIVDAEELPIDTIVVSSWARTGWNVVRPNVLIDATATRDVVAWQQLRGRAMRPHRRWTNACSRAMLLLLGSHAPDLRERGDLPDDVLAIFDEVTGYARSVERLDEETRGLLREAHRPDRGVADGSADDPLDAKIERGALADLSPEERRRLAVELMLARNKVTHVYELVKACGSAPQIRYDRAGHRWTRVEAIAAKHAAEHAASPLGGAYTAGATHAPLVYAGDPRRDVPSALGQQLKTVLDGADTRIVAGWLEATR